MHAGVARRTKPCNLFSLLAIEPEKRSVPDSISEFLGRRRTVPPPELLVARVDFIQNQVNGPAV